VSAVFTDFRASQLIQNFVARDSLKIRTEFLTIRKAKFWKSLVAKKVQRKKR